MADAMHRLIQLLKQLPGIGEKTATRLVHAILAGTPEYGRALGAAVTEVVEKIDPCRVCGNLTELDACSICADSRRDQSLMCVVEKVPDLMAIEASGEFRGLFHVLGGVLNPLDGAGPDQLRVDGLIARLPGEVREVILATSSSVEGEATALYLKRRLEALGLTVSRIAAGIPVGGELEYVDRSTIGLALRGRREMG